MQSYKFKIRLDNVFCTDEGDGSGAAEPYLWAVFFAIDGTTAYVGDDHRLHGTAQIFSPPGAHADLNDEDVNGGDLPVPIPAAFTYAGYAAPIPLRRASHGVAEVPALLGCVYALMEHDSTTDVAARAGRTAMIASVLERLNSLIPTVHFTNGQLDPAQLATFVTLRAAGIEGAQMVDQLTSGDADDLIGADVMMRSIGEVLDAGPGGIAFSSRWVHEGDWTLGGRFTLDWSDWESLGGVLASAPAVASTRDHRLDCFYRGANAHLLHRAWDGAAWSAVDDLGQPAKPIASSPAAVSWAENRLDAFVVTSDHHLAHRWRDGATWSNWADSEATWRPHQRSRRGVSAGSMSSRVAGTRII